MSRLFFNLKISVTTVLSAIIFFIFFLFGLFLFFRIDFFEFQSGQGIDDLGIVAIFQKSDDELSIHNLSNQTVARLKGMWQVEFPDSRTVYISGTSINGQKNTVILMSHGKMVITNHLKEKITRVGPVIIWRKNDQRVVFLAKSKDEIIPLRFPYSLLIVDRKLYLADTANRQARLIEEMLPGAEINFFGKNSVKY